MVMKKKPFILDVTVRDGSYAIDYQYSTERVSSIAAALDAAGIDAMEVSHGCGLGAARSLHPPAAATDLEYVEAAKQATKKIKVGVIAGGSAVTHKRDIDEVIDQVDFIRFAANCDDPRAVEENLSYVKKKKSALLVPFQMMRSSRLPVAKVIESAKIAEEMGVSILYIVDTNGHMLPAQVAELVRSTVSALKIPVGFHAHNNLGLAIANTLAAIEAGALWVDGSLKGIGRSGGNTQLEALVSLMKRLDYARAVDFDALVSAGEKLVKPVMESQGGVSGIDLITADANIDLYPLSLYERIAQAAGIDFITFVRALASDPSYTEVGVDEIKRALSSLGKEPEALLAALGIRK